MSNDQLPLVTSGTFKTMIRRRAPAADLAHVAILKGGGQILKVQPAAPDRSIAFCLSTPRTDLEGDSLLVQGWTDEDCNGAVLWAHDHSQPPIAKSGKPYVVGAGASAKYCAVGSFVPPDLSPFADTIYRMLIAAPPGPYLNSCSVGFRPLEWEMSDTGCIFSKLSLIEWSVCCCPANPDSVVLARAKGIDVRPLQTFYERALDLYHATGDAARMQKAQINRLRIQSDPKGRKFFNLLASLKLPKDATSAVDQSALLSMDQLATQAGTSLSTISDTIRVLMSAPAPALPTGSTAGDVDTNTAAELSTIIQESEHVMAAVTSIHGLASAQAGIRAAVPAIGKAGITALRGSLHALTRMRCKSGRVFSAANEAVLRGVINTLTDLLSQLDQDPEDDKAEIVVDGKRIEDDPNDILAGLGISEAELNSILADILVEQIEAGLMPLTGKVR